MPGAAPTTTEPCPLDWCMKFLYCEDPGTLHTHKGRASLVRTGDASVEVSPYMLVDSDGSSGPRVCVEVEDLNLRVTGQQFISVDLTPADALAFADALDGAADGNAVEDKAATFGTVDDFTIAEGDLIAVTLLSLRDRLGTRECRLVEVAAEWGHEDWSPVVELVDEQARLLASYVRICVADVTR